MRIKKSAVMAAAGAIATGSLAFAAPASADQGAVAPPEQRDVHAANTPISVWHQAGLYSSPSSKGEQRGTVEPGETRQGACWTEGEWKEIDGYKSNIWILLDTWGNNSWATAIAFRGDEHANVPNHC